MNTSGRSSEDPQGRADAAGNKSQSENPPPRSAEFRVVHDRQHDGPDRAHRARFGRRREAEHHRSEDDKDQHGRWNDPEQAPPPQRPAGIGSDVARRRRHPFRLHQRQRERIEGEQPDLDDRRAPGAQIHVADRFAELVGEHDQHERGRDQLGDRSGRGQDARRVPHIVAVADHHRHRNERHRDDLSGNGAGDRAEDEADDDDGIPEPALDRAEQLPHRIEHFFGKPASLQDRAHEGEERYRQQQLVREDVAEYPAPGIACR